MTKIRMGIIGMGMAFERLHYPAFKKLEDKFEIVAVCDTERSKADKWQQGLGLTPEDIYDDYQKMLTREDIDAFDIIVPIELNYEITEEVAKAGKPLICEKPLAPSPEDIKAARKLPQKYDVPILIAENYRYNEENNIIRDLVRKNEIGEIYYFIQNKAINFPEDMIKDKFAAREWRQHPEFPGGVFYDTAVHDLAALQHIFGAVQKVHAFAREQNEDFSPYSVIQANLQFNNNITGQFTFFCRGQEAQKPLVGLRIIGSKGMIYLEERNSGVINITLNNGKKRKLSYRPGMGFYNELLNFYNAAVNKEPISVPPELEYGDAEVVFSLIRSIEKESVIPVGETAEYRPQY